MWGLLGPPEVALVRAGASMGTGRGSWCTLADVHSLVEELGMPDSRARHLLRSINEKKREPLPQGAYLLVRGDRK